MKALGVIVMLVFLTACGSPERESAAPTDAAAETGAPEAGTTTTMGDCVETYSLDTLKNRDFAFDGTISSIDQAEGEGEANDQSWITFDVGKWFKGAQTGEVTLRSATFGAITTAGGIDGKVGDRLLVSGDDDYMWECGFSMAYDADVAADWDETL